MTIHRSFPQRSFYLAVAILACCVRLGWALSLFPSSDAAPPTPTRREFGLLAGGGFTAFLSTAAAPLPSNAAGETPDRLNTEDYLRSGFVANPMGVSGQAGKSRPETGVVLRDGSEVSRDDRTGNVLAEILLQSSSAGSNSPFLASFSSPWKMAEGTVFDVECRDPRTSDGVFLAVSADTKGKSVRDLKDSFFVDQIMAPTGRFSFYGQPTDVRVRKSQLVETNDGKPYRMMDLSFSTLSQSTQTEIPRRARIAATIPEGSAQAVMLVGSSSELRWKKGAEKSVASAVESFRAIPAPQTSLKVRAKPRRTG